MHVFVFSTPSGVFGMKPFLDPNGVFKWFIEREEVDASTAKPTGETVTSWYRYECDYEKGLERYGATLLSTGILKD